MPKARHNRTNPPPYGFAYRVPRPPVADPIILLFLWARQAHCRLGRHSDGRRAQWRRLWHLFIPTPFIAIAPPMKCCGRTQEVLLYKSDYEGTLSLSREPNSGFLRSLVHGPHPARILAPAARTLFHQSLRDTHSELVPEAHALTLTYTLTFP
ncbi:hypothetical protein THAOC_35983 [Thalassiosira oceanica]|uniref:Uncharacterized protein n=1 Tax=Thalassiosira oceanica TaxID=159749 RepID=K0R035_THAOC|nr:hypothetical protein THAOC_35983 [Thalassiosira oceanica]|eukprot:EJK45398.1 hypothetical protein THAOC_35983 [Thalassiosira oceanica]